MPHKPEEASEEAWHRYFAMECNNKAWSLAVSDRNREEDLEMLSAAQASLYHWMLVGNTLNQIRAKMLVAEVHALLGLGDTALPLAIEVSEFFAEHDCPDWEEAYVAAIEAHAASVAGDAERHRESYQRASGLFHAIADPDDKAVVEETFRLVPRPNS